MNLSTLRKVEINLDHFFKIVHRKEYTLAYNGFVGVEWTIERVENLNDERRYMMNSCEICKQAANTKYDDWFHAVGLEHSIELVK